MKQLFIFLTTLLPLMAFTQISADETAVIFTIDQVFDGMRASDTAAVRDAFLPGARLQTTFTDEEGNPQLREGSIENWLTAMARPRPEEEVWDEKIWSYKVEVEDNLATVWTEYTFFRGAELSHCGVNAFQLFRTPEGWKILQVTDTRRQQGCLDETEAIKMKLNALIDDWHIAAATADADAFFGAMTEDGVYIGTDASERWLRDELRTWAAAAFERESAWDFKPLERHIRIGPGQQAAWWDETLDTWMGTCRGSGLLVQTPAGWKIQHYHLSVTVPNEKIEAFIDLVEE